MADILLGENIEITVSGNLNIHVDGDIEVNLEKNLIEKKLRNVAVVQNVVSKRIKVSGSMDGISKNSDIWGDVLSWFIGTATKADGATTLSSITAQPSLDMTFDDKAVTGRSWKLTDVKVNTLKVTYPNEEEVKVTMDYAANGIEKIAG
jgi:hypothetical protein